VSRTLVDAGIILFQSLSRKVWYRCFAAGE